MSPIEDTKGGSRKIARAIVRARPFQITGQLAKLIEGAAPRTGPRLAVLVLVLGTGLLGFQEGTEASCDNFRSTDRAHRCTCMRAMTQCKLPGDKAEPDAACKTFCKPEHCHCAGPSCTSRK